MERYEAIYPSSLGPLTLVASDTHLLSLTMDTQVAKITGKSVSAENVPILTDTFRWLDSYFSGQIIPKTPPLMPFGTPFQKQVWQLLIQIPYGETVTYGELARQLAGLNNRSHMSAQAVGQAVGANPISIIIPCHRVIGTRGKLTGYAGGISRKIWLLRHEGSLYE